MLSIKRIKIFWIWALLIFIALFFISANLGGKRSWDPSEQLVIEIIAPLQIFINETINLTERVWLKYFGLINTHNENIRMKKELDSLKIENYLYQEMLAANQRLQQLLQFRNMSDQPVIAAQVIGRDPTGWFQSVIIDKGKNSGIKLNMPVVNAEGVVGKLVSVSNNYSKVLLIIDQNSSVDCIIQRSRDDGILKGLSSGVCKLDYVLKSSDVHVGDVVVTSGLGGIFPKGIPVGEVTDVEDPPGELFKDVRIRPAVDFSKLEELLIILKEDPLANYLTDED
ncbi:MAG: rod shape-determining protein MreC [Deltaproteobacteria bacterium RBG_19FT_COMBO_46_9]|nr:MAG: rod shape-determining protein MreC [Deltaproteobacteria bacterium RBG_19FT_COMBO_46_9]